MYQLWLEYGKTAVLVLSLAALALCALEAWRAWRRRADESGRMFPVVPRPVLPHEDDGPGTYEVTGVLERLGTPTHFTVEAKGVPDAVQKAIERGVSPAAVTKQRQ